MILQPTPVKYQLYWASSKATLLIRFSINSQASSPIYHRSDYSP